MLSKRQISISINRYAFSFLLIITMLLVGVGWFAYQGIEQARANIQIENQKSANEEIHLAIDSMVQDMLQLSRKIKDWDEIFQQLDNPAYYSYWREHRMLSNDLIPDHIVAAEVFSDVGKALAQVPDSLFALDINLNELEPRVIKTHEDIHMVMFLPIKRDLMQSRANGYIGVRFPFIDALFRHGSFRHIDFDTLYLEIADSQTIGIKDIPKHLKFDFKPNQEAESLMRIIQSALLQLAVAIIVLFLIFYFLLVYLFGKPLLSMSEYIDLLRLNKPDEGKLKSRFVLQIAEIEKVKDSLHEYNRQLNKAHGELDQKNQELWEQAHHDPLTSVMNRRAFENEWQEAQHLLKNHRVGIGLVVFDVNHFKAINDSYGHQVGDDVLVTISHAIQENLRKGEQLFRLGGDEFATIVIGGTAEDGMNLSQRCIDAVSNINFEKMGIKERVKISSGVAHCQANEMDSIDDLKWQADVAVYQAKKPGNTMPVLFTQEMADGTEAIFSSWINDAVYEAVVSGKGIEMHYQPVVLLNSEKVDYYESLLRIRHEKQMIPPSNIFSIVASRNLEVQMDQMIIKQLLLDLQSDMIPHGTGISLNLSADAVADPKLVDWLKILVPQLKMHKIILEVTETSLITQMNAAIANLEQLRALGFKVALDDFGSGYSSLRYLTTMPVDTIKFDISLIHGLLKPRLGELVVELANLLGRLDYQLVAEGLETVELLDASKTAGFTHGQGYFYARPGRAFDTTDFATISQD